jgi:hypothetical protein
MGDVHSEDVGAGEVRFDDDDDARASNPVNSAFSSFRNIRGSSSLEEGIKPGQLKVAVVAVNLLKPASWMLGRVFPWDLEAHYVVSAVVTEVIRDVLLGWTRRIFSHSKEEAEPALKYASVHMKVRAPFS